MKKRTKILLGLLIFSLVGLGLYFYLDNHNYYQQGDSDKFKISIGDSFTIKVSENGSTGFSNCWINENNCQFVKLLDRQYQSSWVEKSGSIGSGGTVALTFVGTTIGTDTIKISDCPTGIMQKDCSYFVGDSLRLISEDSVISKYVPYRQADYTFIVTVTD